MVRESAGSGRLRKAVRYVLLSLLGVVSLAIGLGSLWHPFAAWLPGVPRRSDAPPVVGVGALVIPVVLIGIVARRAWWALDVDFEVWRERGRRARRRSS